MIIGLDDMGDMLASGRRDFVQLDEPADQGTRKGKIRKACGPACIPFEQLPRHALMKLMNRV